MGLFDTVRCDYPLPDAAHQSLEFQTKDFERSLDEYLITRDGRLVRRARPRETGLVRDVECPFHGDVRIYDLDPHKERGLVEYVVRFTNGRVEWVRRLDNETGSPIETAGEQATVAPEEGLKPGKWVVA